MKRLDELKPPRRRDLKACKRTESAAATPTPERAGKRSGVPLMPRKGYDYAYELEKLYDTFNL